MGRAVCDLLPAFGNHSEAGFFCGFKGQGNQQCLTNLKYLQEQLMRKILFGKNQVLKGASQCTFVSLAKICKKPSGGPLSQPG